MISINSYSFFTDINSFNYVCIFSFIGLLLNSASARRMVNYGHMVQDCCLVMENYFTLCLRSLNVDPLIVNLLQFRNMTIRHIKISIMLPTVLKMQWKNSGGQIIYVKRLTQTCNHPFNLVFAL